MVAIYLPQKNPHSSIASGCVPGAPRVVLYKFGQIDMVCTHVQAIYFEVGTYEYDRTQYRLVVYDIFYEMERGCTIHFRQKKQGRGNIIVPPVVRDTQNSEYADI